SEWPEPVVGLGKVSRLTGSMAGSFCALGEDGYTKCWGSNSGGQIGRHTDDAGTPSSEGLATPEMLEGAPKGIVFTGKDIGCVLPETGNLVCWGTDDRGYRLSRTLEYVRAIAMPIDIGGDALAELAIGDESVVARTKSGRLISWGMGSGGHAVTTLGRWSSLDPSPPSPIALGESSSIAGGAFRACAITTGGLYCWGRDESWNEESGFRAPSYVRFSTEARADSLAAAALFGCATFEDGVARCWGDNRYGQLGSGDIIEHLEAVEVRGLAAPAVRIVVGDDSACALLQDGRVQCWGANRYGQLGTGALDGRTHLVPEYVKWQR
ncbi:MAG: regulator of chromosome condensation, partial [Labilithrix sp.]|nr:regulator of chromosome condensation [Labilithrix sp.]